MNPDHRAFIDNLAPTFGLEQGEIADLSQLADLVALHEAAGFCLISNIGGKQIFLSSQDLRAMEAKTAIEPKNVTPTITLD